ncbi:PREDICTED: interleukin-10 [Mesitornis unicolor]|uniref:interleukin-10 n=1 Tax=Mesitornis unicolor TaxID=54374 RepID=UPI0005294A15|nr:PREDICTED: interleukin-10 [Mesitornis unicolor]
MRGSIKVKAADRLGTLLRNSAGARGAARVSSMQPRSALLCLILAACTLPTQGSAPLPACLHFPELLPAKLRELRTKFEEIKDYFQSKDYELSIQLLSSELLDEFKGSFGCQSVSEMMRFYTEEVLPSAMRTSTQHQQSMGDLGNLLLSLRATMRRCHRFFTCEKRSKATKHIKETFDKMHENGIYKAMGEFDIFINYIEEYLLMNRKK